VYFEAIRLVKTADSIWLEAGIGAPVHVPAPGTVHEWLFHALIIARPSKSAA
jgi:hypothetical protein